MSSMLVHIKFTSGKGTEDNGWSKKRGGVRLKKTYKSAKNASTKQSLSWKAWEWWRTTNQSSQSFAVNNGGWLTASSRLESSCTAESEDQSADKTLLIVYKQTKVHAILHVWHGRKSTLLQPRSCMQEKLKKKFWTFTNKGG